MDIQYKIEFYSNWHCGSGLAAGADVDALVVKDADGLPYVPGRTMKGLLREAAYALYGNTDLTASIFGRSGEADAPKSSERTGHAFFENAVLSEEEKSAVKTEKLAPYLFQAFASTAIDENGIAKANFLRRIETVVPCTLVGSIRNVPDGGKDLLENAMLMVKRMGTGRNRGYGRCKITIVNS